MPSDNAIEAAKAYLALGYSVFPCRPGDKKPLIDSWLPYQQSPPTVTQIEAWWAQNPKANIAIVTGKVSGLTVIDIDGAQGVQSMNELAPHLAKTLCIKTPHGYHLYYRHNPSFHTGAGFRPGLDVRSDGGYVIAPPSVCDNLAYTIFRDNPVVALELNPELLKASGNGHKPAAAPEQPGWVSEALAYGAPEKQRNSTATKLAGYFHGKGHPADIVMVLLQQFGAKCTPPMSEHELETIAHSIERYPAAASILEAKAPALLYAHEGQTIATAREIASQTWLSLRATNISRAPTGVHANIAILLNDVTLAWGYINVDKDEDRVRHANSAYKHVEREPAFSLTKEQLKRELDAFCAGLWSETLGRFTPEEITGAEERHGVSFALEPYIVQGGGTIMFAPPGAGKSYLGLLMAVSIDAGIRTFWPVKQQKVLYLNLERGDASFSQRLGNINACLGLPRQRPLRMLNARGQTLSTIADSASLYVQRQEIGVVLLDSISRAGFGKLVADEVGNSIMDSLNAMSPTWLAIAHTPRADKSHPLGTMMFDAAADLLVQVSSQTTETATGVCLNITKDNDVGRRRPTMLALEFDSGGLTAVRPTRPFEFSDLLSSAKDTRAEVLDYLRDRGKAPAAEIAEALDVSRARIVQILGDRQTFVELPREGKSKPFAVRSKDTPF